MAITSRTTRFAARTARMRVSTIREMLKVTQQPDIISFGGGLPAPELFPTDDIAECVREVMNEAGGAALQYSVTDGIPAVREWVAQRLTERIHAPFDADEVLVCNGSQQGLDLLGKIFIDPGDHVVLENPSYLGAIQAFDAYQARYLTAETDDEGMIPESLERVLAHAEPLPKFIYLVPNFQNPTGRTLASDRRERIVQIAEHYGVPIVEDDPYGELRFEGEHQRALVSYKTSGTIIYSGTASKIMAPGLRIAWLATHDDEVLQKLILAKQGADLQSGTLTQYLFAKYVSKREAFERHLARIIETYGHRRDVMYKAMLQHMPENVRYNRPAGGMFLWAFADGVDTTELLKVSAQEKVVFVPGVSFYPNRDVTSGMRLNFSNSNDEDIHRGIERLARAIKES